MWGEGPGNAFTRFVLVRCDTQGSLEKGVALDGMDGTFPNYQLLGTSDTRGSFYIDPHRL